MVRSKAVIEPEVDERKVKRESQKVEKALSEAEQLEPRVDTRAMQRDMDKVEGPSFGGAGGGAATPRPGSIGRRSGGGGFAAGAVGGRLAGGGGSALGSLGGVASKVALPVALAGAVGFGILKATKTVAKASPAFGQQQEMFGAAMRNFQAPFGRALADAISPGVNSLLEASVEFRKAAEKEGLSSALSGALIEDPFQRMVESESPTQRAIAGGQLGTLLGGVFGGPMGAAVGGSLLAGIAATGLPGHMADLAAGIPELERSIDAFDAEVSAFDWGDWVRVLSWSRFLNPISWPSLVAQLTWDAFVDPIEWPSAEELMSGLTWPTITAAALLNPITWPVVGAGLIIGAIGWPTISAGDITDALTGDGPTNTGNTSGSTTLSTGPAVPDITIGHSGGSPIDIEGVSVSGIGDVTGLQHGGIVTGPRQGVVGEAGPEAVLPLDTFLNDLGATIRSALGGSDDDALGSDARRLLENIHRELRRNTEATNRVDDRIRDLETGGSALVSR